MSRDASETPAPVDNGASAGTGGAHMTPRYYMREGGVLWKRRGPDKGQRSYSPRVRDCKHCGKRFKPTQRTARYCSHSCRQGAYAKRKAAERRKNPPVPELALHTCQHCGNTWLERPRTLRRYCRPACAEAARKARKRAAAAAFSSILNLSAADAFDVLERLGSRGAREHLAMIGYIWHGPTRAFVAA